MTVSLIESGPVWVRYSSVVWILFAILKTFRTLYGPDLYLRPLIWRYWLKQSCTVVKIRLSFSHLVL